MDMEVILRNPIPGDIGWLISQHGRLYAEQFNFDSDFERDIAKKVASFLETQDPFNTLWIAIAGDQPVGSIAVSLKPDRTAFINFLLVIPEQRGRGIATTLMETVVSHCTEHKVALLRLETYSCLTSARELYRRYGFTLSTRNVDVKKYGQTFDQEFWEKAIRN
jgi:ribosomal protein S18 acetylase RimI-like enzyme